MINSVSDATLAHGPQGGIVVTGIVQPTSGAVMFLYCPGCKVTEIAVSKYAVKPKDGDYWFLRMNCGKHSQVRYPTEFPMYATP